MRERNPGIDLLRMTAMGMVAVLHVLNVGGLLAAAVPLSGGWMMGKLLDDGAYCAVNCYALISGYVGVGEPFRLRRPIALWLQTVFWTLSTTALFALLAPETVNADRWIRAFFPVLSRQYWYVTAYFGICLFIPFFNRLVNALSPRQGRQLVGGIVLVFSLLPTIRQMDVFNANSGYSPLWLGCLYLVGACMRRWEWRPHWRPLAWFGVWLSCALTAWGLRVVVNGLWLKTKGELWPSALLTGYLSPTVLLGAAALVCGFSRLKIPSRAAAAIAWASPLSFGVYLIHAHPLTWMYGMTNRFAFLADEPPVLLAAGVLGCAAGIYLLCTLAEALRRKIFALASVPRAAAALGRALEGRLALWTEGG